MSAVPEIGDWIAFIRDGRIVIAEVRYTRPARFGSTDLVTDIGTANSEHVYEVRRPTGATHDR